MSTLIAFYNSEGCVGRCDAKCYNAKTPSCDCICAGINHGVGYHDAQANTLLLALEWARRYNEDHPPKDGAKGVAIHSPFDLLQRTLWPD